MARKCLGCGYDISAYDKDVKVCGKCSGLTPNKLAAKVHKRAVRYTVGYLFDSETGPTSISVDDLRRAINKSLGFSR